jgi:hypothetical protein
MRNHKSQKSQLNMLCRGSEKDSSYRPFYWTNELERTDVYTSGYIDALLKRNELLNYESSIWDCGTCSTLRDEGTQTISYFRRWRRKLHMMICRIW